MYRNLLIENTTHLLLMFFCQVRVWFFGAEDFEMSSLHSLRFWFLEIIKLCQYAYNFLFYFILSSTYQLTVGFLKDSMHVRYAHFHYAHLAFYVIFTRVGVMTNVIDLSIYRGKLFVYTWHNYLDNNSTIWIWSINNIHRL